MLAVVDDGELAPWTARRRDAVRDDRQRLAIGVVVVVWHVDDALTRSRTTLVIARLRSLTAILDALLLGFTSRLPDQRVVQLLLLCLGILPVAHLRQLALVVGPHTTFAS